ncbi:MAG: GspE/PulE family protein [Burkholderiaceae bacterium]
MSSPSAEAKSKSASTPRGKLNWRDILRWMHSDGLISKDEAERIFQKCAAASSSQHALQRLTNVSVHRASDGKKLDLDGITHWLAQHAGLPYLKIDPLKVDVARIADVMSIAYAERNSALPVNITPTEIIIATCEPFDTGWVPEIERTARKTVSLVVASPAELTKYTTEFYALARSVKAAVKAGGGATTTSSFEQLVELGKTNRQLDANDQGVIQVVDWLWQYAFDQRASDIHLEPRREIGAIRFRIDGVLHTVYQLPMGVMNAITSRIKLLGRMDVVEKRRPQDGRIKTVNPSGDEVEMRLSTLPTAFGEKMVMRIFDPEVAVQDLDALGFGEADAKRWVDLTARPHGIILVTGPTGSGKTTTLYSTLRRLATDQVNVCTVEDPIEMIEPAFNQMQVQPQLEIGFPQALRSLMRQDPDIIMVGEIRDLETAEMAVQAALTGHLVFSTLHTNDAPSAISRLLELGVPAYLINATVLGVLAQRLVRTLCPHCKTDDDRVNAADIAALAKPWKLNGIMQPKRGMGCIECRMTGYKGRTGLYELLTMSEDMKALIHASPDITALRRHAVKEGMLPLRVVGVSKVASGQTSIAEVLQATPVLDLGG